MIKKITFLLLAIVTGTLLFAQTINPGYLDGKVWVRLRMNINPKTGSPIQPNYVADKQSLPFEKQLSDKYQISGISRAFREDASDKLNRTLELSFSNFKLIDQLVADLKSDPTVELAEKIPLNTRHIDVNDPSYSNQWHLAKIKANLAWNYFSIGSNIVIAIVDDAVDLNHPDLNANIWRNTGEIPGNGLDDDNNGYVDDVFGWDLASNDNDPSPPTTSYDHGTHVAGIASGVSNNGVGIASIGYSCKLMAIKASGTDPNSIVAGYSGILYATNNGAHVINMSWGSGNFSFTNEETIKYALSKNVILVASAGNNNNDAFNYPGAYEGVVSVASTNIDDIKSSFSTYGGWVKISAPGSAILSTVPYGSYGNKQGTSMASPLVAGLVGLMKSLNPGMPNNDLINCLYSTADPILTQNPLFPGQLGAGRINALAAMECVSSTLNNAPIAEFTGSPTTVVQGGSVRFTDASLYNPTAWQWSFPGGTPATFTGKTPPLIVYNTPGTYSVSLTATNAFGNQTKTRTNYITVNPTPSCIRINLPLPSNWTPISYASGLNNVNGFANGLNSLLDKQKAMYFDVSSTSVTGITGVQVRFARANSSNLSKLIRFRVYDGTSGAPGAELGVFERTIGEIRQDVLNQTNTIIDFTKNILLPDSKKFFVSVDLTQLEWNATTKDSLSIFSNLGGQTPNSPVWDQKADGVWRNYGSANTWAFNNLSLLIHPVLTSQPAFSILSPTSVEVCRGSAVNLDATGSNFNSLLRWELPGAIAPVTIENQLRVSVQYAQPGTYKAILTTNGGCDEIRKDSATILIKASPTLVVTASKNPICEGETATLTATGGTNYTWTPSLALNTTTGGVVLANPINTTTYTLTGFEGTCSGTVPYELEVRATTAQVNLEASQVNISAPTSVTFLATGFNSGGNPIYVFKVNNVSRQNGSSNSFTSMVSPDDLVVCEMTSSEPCVTQPVVSSNVIKMGEGALPVTLSQFSGRKTTGGNLLEWTTATEINSSLFRVERSSNGRDFIPLASITARGTSLGLVNYQWTDSNPLEGKNFYRLKMEDRDGSFSYSNIILLNGDQQEGFVNLYPNPIRSGQTGVLSFSGLENGKVGITMTNVFGQVIRETQQVTTNGNLQLSIPTNNLTNGVYLLSIKNESGILMKTIRWIIVP